MPPPVFQAPADVVGHTGGSSGQTHIIVLGKAVLKVVVPQERFGDLAILDLIGEGQARIEDVLQLGQLNALLQAGGDTSCTRSPLLREDLNDPGGCVRAEQRRRRTAFGDFDPLNINGQEVGQCEDCSPPVPAAVD